MRARKILKIFVGLLFIFAIAGCLISISHPIILKWLSGTATYIGKPISATVYANGEINLEIEVFRVNSHWNKKKTEYYLLHFLYADTKETRKIICINPEYNFVGRPSSTNKREYDKVYGILFQGEVGSKFNSFMDDIKGYNFDPQLKTTKRTIKLNIPPDAKEFKCDSLRIEL